MTNPTSRAEIEALLAERGRFETWLDQLSAKASTMPPHVVERVRADYQQRLDKVMSDLLAQSETMRTEAAELDERVRALASELSGKRDARAEDELRALVGEYDADAWDRKAAEHDAGIQAIESERAARETEFNRLQQLLGESRRPARPATPISSPAVEGRNDADSVASPAPPVDAIAAQVEGAPPPSDGAADPKAAPPEPAPPPPVAKRPSPFDEIGFMRAVVGRTTPYAGVEIPSLDDAAPRTPPQTPAKENKAVPEEPAPAPQSATEAEGRSSGPEPARPSAEQKAVPTFEAPPIPDAPIVAPVRASSPAIPMMADESALAESMRASTTMPDAARTLKCQECGWMNYPTEWYCEKCGGELAAF
jgi:hypothetical protein